MPRSHCMHSARGIASCATQPRVPRRKRGLHESSTTMADAGRADLSRIGVGSLVLSAQGMKSEHRREHATLQVRCSLYMQQSTCTCTDAQHSLTRVLLLACAWQIKAVWYLHENHVAEQQRNLPKPGRGSGVGTCPSHARAPSQSHPRDGTRPCRLPFGDHGPWSDGSSTFPPCRSSLVPSTSPFLPIPSFLHAPSHP